MKARFSTPLVSAAFLASCAFSMQQATAQYSQLTIDGKLSTNYTFGSVSGLPGKGASVGVHYSPCRLLSMNTEVGAGSLYGNGVAKTPVYEGGKVTRLNAEKYDFNTGYTSLSGSVYLNLHKLFEPVKKAKTFIPYAYAGMALLNSNSIATDLTFNITRKYDRTYYATFVGVEAKVKGTKDFDYLFSVQQNFTQTAYLDGIPGDESYDSFISFSVGVSYHVNFSRQKTHIDWSRQCICPQSLY